MVRVIDTTTKEINVTTKEIYNTTKETGDSVNVIKESMMNGKFALLPIGK